MAGKANKQYGLILPSKGQSSRAPTVPRKNVFGDDSDSDSDDGGDWVKKSLKREAQKSVLKRTTKVQMQKAVAEDPTVFQYDEIYEDMEQKRVEVTTAKKGVEKKPRYIQALLQTAERRKKENERRIERQVQKEREEEGNQFADKESFVTSSYRQKLEEFKKQEEEEKRMDRLEAIGDVTKQKDLTGFYRHIYRQTMGESLAGIGDAIIAEKEDSETNKNVEAASENFEKTGKKVVAETNQKKDRQYRKRCSSSSSSEESGKESRANNSSKGKSIDADSDFTGSSSSSSENESSVTGSGSEEGEIRKKKVSKAASNEVDVPKKKQKKIETHDKSDKNLDDTPLVKNDSVTQVFKVKEETEPSLDKLCVKSEAEDTDNHKNESDTGDSRGTVEVKKTKVDIWAKRTIGDVFDDAVRRYYERKAARVTFKRA